VGSIYRLMAGGWDAEILCLGIGSTVDTEVECPFRAHSLWVESVLPPSQLNLAYTDKSADEFGTTEQKERYLPGMAKGKILGAFGLTEREFPEWVHG